MNTFNKFTLFYLCGVTIFVLYWSYLYTRYDSWNIKNYNIWILWHWDNQGDIILFIDEYFYWGDLKNIYCWISFLSYIKIILIDVQNFQSLYGRSRVYLFLLQLAHLIATSLDWYKLYIYHAPWGMKSLVVQTYPTSRWE